MIRLVKRIESHTGGRGPGRVAWCISYSVYQRLLQEIQNAISRKIADRVRGRIYTNIRSFVIQKIGVDKL